MLKELSLLEDTELSLLEDTELSDELLEDDDDFESFDKELELSDEELTLLWLEELTELTEHTTFPPVHSYISISLIAK